MPFKSQNEMDNMMASDPKKAMQFIQHAKAMGKPVVSSKNPGYGDAAKRRLSKQLKSKTDANKGVMDMGDSYK